MIGGDRVVSTVMLCKGDCANVIVVVNVMVIMCSVGW